MFKLLYPYSPSSNDIAELLQTTISDSQESVTLERKFLDWFSTLLDLPGVYYLETLEKLYKANALALGGFSALGVRLDLSKMCSPTFLLAARDDELVGAEQTLATEHLVGTSSKDLVRLVVPGRHIGLFMGKHVLSETWPSIAQWLNAQSEEERVCWTN